MKNKAVIFDFDGVIGDTQGDHSKNEAELLSRYGVNLSAQEITRRYSGVRTIEFFTQLLGTIIPREEIQDLMLEKRRMMIEHISAYGVDPIVGAPELVRSLDAIGVPLAVASASNSQFVGLALETMDLRHFFDQIVTGDQVTNGKPDPEIFLVAARRLGVAARNCIVIEDGIAGMKAAKSAGMACLALVPDVDEDYPTLNRVTALEGVSVDWLLGLEP